MVRIVSISVLIPLQALLLPVAKAADQPDSLVASESGFRVQLVLHPNLLDQIAEAVDQIRWGSYGDEVRGRYPIAAYIADNSEDKLWLPLWISWIDEADLSSFDPDVWARIGERWYPMKELIFVDMREGGIGFAPLGPRTVLKPNRYIAGKLGENEDPRQAHGMIAFPRTRKFNAKKIEEIRFTADREARPLKRDG